MKDKDIRKILISYLQAQGQEMRIYQEKSIGKLRAMGITNIDVFDYVIREEHTRPAKH